MLYYEIEHEEVIRLNDISNRMSTDKPMNLIEMHEWAVVLEIIINSIKKNN